MSQPQLTKFFGNTKRGAKVGAKTGKLLDPVEPTSKRATRSSKTGGQETIKVVTEKSLKETNVVKKSQSDEKIIEKENNNKTHKDDSCPSPSKRSRTSSISQIETKKDVEQASNTPKKRTKAKAKLYEDSSIESPASPSKKSKADATKSITEAIQAANELQGKLTPKQVKEQLKGLKGKNKLALLRNQLKSIEENAKTVEQVRAEAKAKKEASEAAAEAEKKVKAKEATPAYKRFHNLAAEDDSGLPLPFAYKFIKEVFRCTETIGAMYHNRSEAITLEKMKKGVQQMMRKNFEVEYLKQIKTVFPAAYKYAWDNVLGRYGKTTSNYELKLQVNLDYRSETLGLLSGDNEGEEKVKIGKLTPQGMIERRNILQNSLVDLVKDHHAKFCTSIGINVMEEKIKRFHKDFDVEACPGIPCTELPEKPEVPKYASAAEVLEKARDLFEANPRIASVLQEVADKNIQEETKKDETVVTKAEPVVPKALSNVPMTLLEKIRAKERDKKAREMYQDKGEEVRMKQLKRLPDIARIVKGVFVSEKKNALKQLFVLQKVYQSYPGYMEKDDLAKDLAKLAEVSTKWISMHTIQMVSWMKLDKETDVNIVVKDLEILAQTKN